MRDADLLRPERGWARPDYVRIPAPPQRQRGCSTRRHVVVCVVSAGFAGTTGRTSGEAIVGHLG